MKIKSYKELKHINHRAIFEAMRCAGESVNPDEAAHEMEILIRHARRCAGDYRDCRAYFRHHREMANRNKHYFDLRGYLLKLELKYTNRSIVFQYMLEAVSCVNKTFDQVNNDYKRHPVPPAFDVSKQSPLSYNPNDLSDPDDIRIANIGREYRIAFYKWIDNTDDPIIVQIKDILHNPREYRTPDGRIKVKPKKYALTRNGSTSGIPYHGDTMMDIEGQCIMYSHLEEMRFDNISDYFGVMNMSSDDDRVYLKLDSPIEDCSVVHMMVPDKDGKAREVYYLLPIVSAVGKGIADILDMSMRKLAGIYTYDQQLWIEYALDLEWNKHDMIITVDMEKFSDTINRKHFLTLLYHLGIPKKVISELDELYSLKVWDKILNKPLGYHNVILQGQYSIFMLMSLLNLCLQRYIVHQVDNLKPNEYNSFVSRLLTAVLGDDTAMKFKSHDFERAWKLINDQYGSMGMMINQLKSDHMIDGVGQADFAKTHFDRYGIIDHMNPKNVENHNIDGIINDILWLHRSDEYKASMLTSLFDKETCDLIMDMSIINGGCSDRPIEQRDINYMINNIQRFQLQYRELNQLEEERVLQNLRLDYRSIGFSLKDSPLYYYVPEELRGELDRLNVDQQDDMITVFVLNAHTIGMNPDYPMLQRLVGKVPSELHQEYVNSRLYNYQSDEADLWINVRQYDQFVAKRKTEKKGQYSSLFLPLMDRSYKELMSDYKPVLYSRVEDIRSMDQYRKAEMAYKKGLKDQILRSEHLYIWSRYNWGLEHFYIDIWDLDYTHKVTYRISYVKHDSVYDELTSDIYDSDIAPRLRRHGLNLDFDSFRSML